MANGFCSTLLNDLADQVDTGIFPSDKVTEPGLLLSLLDDSDQTVRINDTLSQNGHYTTANGFYMPRGTEEQVQEAISCGGGVIPAFKEVNIPVNNIVQVSLGFDRDVIRNYCNGSGASKMVKIGGVEMPIMEFVRKSIFRYLNGAYQKMDRRLAQSLSAAAGTAVTLNFNKAGNTFDLTSGMAQMNGILQDKEFCDRPKVVGGSNIFRNFTYAARQAAIGLNQAGLKADNMDYDFYWDKKMQGITGTAEDVIFMDKGAATLVYRNQNVASFSGMLGVSEFGQFEDPRIQCRYGNALTGMPWEIQIKPIDCATTLVDAYDGQSKTFNAGWQVYISKKYDLFVLPADAYDGKDVLAGHRGLVKATVSNT